MQLENALCRWKEQKATQKTDTSAKEGKQFKDLEACFIQIKIGILNFTVLIDIRKTFTPVMHGGYVWI